MGRLPHPMFVGSVAFDPAGRTLATDAADGTVRIWDLASLRQLGRPLPGAENGTGTNSSAFDPSGNHLIALYDSGIAFVWDMNPDRWKQQACTVVGRPLSREEWNELLADRRTGLPASSPKGQSVSVSLNGQGANRTTPGSRTGRIRPM